MAPTAAPLVIHAKFRGCLPNEDSKLQNLKLNSTPAWTTWSIAAAVSRRAITLARATIVSRWEILGFQTRSRTILALDRIVNFLAMHGDVIRRIDAEANLVAADVHDRDLDVVTDHDRFVSLSR
jgi:hypothetical protein